MPTGYTAGIYDGKDVSAEDFILRCARAFGATITMRDDPLDKPIPDAFEPSSYHAERLAESESELERYENMTVDEMRAEQEREHEEALRHHAEAERKNTERQARYEKVLWGVQRWQPPTTEHEALKAFCIEQLRTSLKYDCHHTEPPTKQPLDVWWSEKLEVIRGNIRYHTEEHAKEIERAKGRTKWVRQLQASLGA